MFLLELQVNTDYGLQFFVDIINAPSTNKVVAMNWDTVLVLQQNQKEKKR